MRPLHDGSFVLGVKSGLNRSFISINSLIPCAFSLLENKIPDRAKVSVNSHYAAFFASATAASVRTHLLGTSLSVATNF